MPQIVKKQEMAKGTVVWIELETPVIAKKAKPGQFVIVRLDEKGERIPLTIADKDEFAGRISIIFQVVGKTTAMMRSLKEGDIIKDVVGPLGNPAEIKQMGTVLMVGGGTGIAILHHVTKAFRDAGNHVLGIIGSKTKDLLFLESEMRNLCHELKVTTDDGSYGEKGFVTDPLSRYLEDRNDIELVYAIGPVVMMKKVCELTKKYSIPTKVSLNTIMIDGTGMCGGCRVDVGNQTKFCCVDGPDFNGHEVDFDELEKRNSLYMKQEQEALLFSINKSHNDE